LDWRLHRIDETNQPRKQIAITNKHGKSFLDRPNLAKNR
jgi:hypothetical protein